MRLDYREKFPSGMEEYLSLYGWHFSKKMCEWAASKMYKKVMGRNEYIDPMTKERLDALLKQYGITLEKNNGYDAVYIANMCKADFLGSSIRDEGALILYVKDVIDDPDGYEGLPFTRFYADCIGSGTVISWEDMI
jgi:hypothetical protein